MAAPKSAVSKAVAQIASQAQEIDNRRQKQIANQIEIINMLSDQGGYDDVMEDLVRRLSEAQARIDVLEADLRAFQAEA